MITMEIFRTIAIILITVIVGALAFCAFMMAQALTEDYRFWVPEDKDDDEGSSETETTENDEK